MSRRGLASLSGAGLFAGAAAWGLHQQAGVIVASWACGPNAAPDIWLSGLLAAIVLLGGAVLSGLGLRTARNVLPDYRARPRRFMAVVGLMAGGLFLFALGLQVAASFYLPGCIG